MSEIKQMLAGLGRSQTFEDVTQAIEARERNRRAEAKQRVEFRNLAERVAAEIRLLYDDLETLGFKAGTEQFEEMFYAVVKQRLTRHGLGGQSYSEPLAINGDNDGSSLNDEKW